MEKKDIPHSWIGRRVRITMTVTTDRTTLEEGVLVDLNQLGIALSRPKLTGSGDEVVFYPWAHVYQLGPPVE